jgi:hypothetical protein
LALPPVELPKNFLDENVKLFGHNSRPKLHPALIDDAVFDKVSPPLVPKPENGQGTQQSNEAIVVYFSEAVDVACAGNESLLKQRPSDSISENVAWVDQWVINNQILLDSGWHLADALYPARNAEYTYRIRPFWWWHFYRDFDRRTNKFRGHHPSTKSNLLRTLMYYQHLRLPLAHSIPDFDEQTFDVLCSDVKRELNTTAPRQFDPKVSQRPITIISMSGYGGKVIAESLADQVGWSSRADVVHLDAFDLSILVGEYIGQDWAYNRGPLSMLGFRAAEINGKLADGPERPSRVGEDEDDDADSSLISVRSLSSSLEEELQKKSKPRGYDVFTKWEHLKIDKILDEIIRSPKLKSSPECSRPILIHLHDIVELNLTLEGSLLVARLRALVDTAWHQGMNIAILGTSSSEEPSEEYQEALREASVRDFVITRHVQPQRADKITALTTSTQPKPFELQKTEIMCENWKNINRMIAALDPSFAKRHGLVHMDRPYLLYLGQRKGSRAFMLQDSIRPPPELHFLAKACMEYETQKEGLGSMAMHERFRLGPLWQKPGQEFLPDDQPSGDPDSKSHGRNGHDTEPERATQKLNDYEKRIASGQINTDDIRVTFADVHVPPDTISALKVLTSLALVRPDAFSYGVLATDKIPGCLLYGPPGTGKTMLAKAVAKESGANMLEISGASINDKWVGESEKLIRAVFTLAKRLEPCVVFIDEADSLFASRSMFSNRASHREHINQFLREWDGMRETNAFIMVATNRPFDLDDAVLRRLPRKILVDLPLKEDRAAILRLLLRGETLEESISIESLAERTAFYSGSDLKNVCVAAAMAAVEEENEAAARHTGPEPYQYPKKRTLRQDHFERALQQIPASISEDMESLKQIRKFDEEYGNRRKKTKRSMGFGIVDDKKQVDVTDARIRP